MAFQFFVFLKEDDTDLHKLQGHSIATHVILTSTIVTGTVQQSGSYFWIYKQYHNKQVAGPEKLKYSKQ